MTTLKEQKQKLAQQKARTAKREAALRAKERKLKTKGKIVAGGLLKNISEKYPEMRAIVLSEAKLQVTRESDIEALDTLLDDLKALDTPPPLPKDDLEELSDEEAAEMGLT